MKMFKDVKLNKEFLVDDADSIVACEEYERPYDLEVYDVWYVDGAGYNGKISRYAYGTSKDTIFITELTKNMTNNEMEYCAMMGCMNICMIDSIIYTDSQLVAHQINGLYKCKADNLKNYFNKCLLLKKLKRIDVRWIEREKNIVGIELDKSK